MAVTSRVHIVVLMLLYPGSWGCVCTVQTEPCTGEANLERSVV